MSRFDAARAAALVQDLLAALRGQPADLLPFEEVRSRLKLARGVDRGLEEVPLERIRGTLDRATEFTNAFLPRRESLRDRWEDVATLAEGHRGFPPVVLYRVGEVYFVVDGHHRVSVARALGAETIEARVTEFETPVPLPPDASLEDVVLREGLAGFLEATGLVPEHPDEWRVTEPGGYDRLLDHIAVHRYFLGLDRRRDVSWEEAVASFRDTVIRPMVERIRASGVLDGFPGRTETDLYLFLADHLRYLRERFGDRAVPAERAVKHFALRQKAERHARRRFTLFRKRRRPESP